MKRIRLFEEADIEGNPGIPGEPTRREGESSYIRDVSQRARQRLRINPEDTRLQMVGRPSRKEMELGGRIMQLVAISRRDFIRGYERELENLAENLFRMLYDELIDRYNILLDLKIARPRLEPPDTPGIPDERFREVKDEEVLNQIHKRKLANLIIQGEAKNTKHILHMEECKEGLKEIYGDKKGEEAFRIFDEMTKIADQLDWIIDIWIRRAMMENDPSGANAAGSVEVQWVEEENDDEAQDDDSQEESYDEDDEEEYSYDDYSQEDSYEQGDDSYNEDEDEDDFMGNLVPKIKARAIDFPMLLHESVKGLFEILSLGGIPEDEETAKTVLLNTGKMDEPEDWKFGPEVAADLRDFVNENPNIDKYPNIREELFKLMIDKDTMPVKDFLELMRGILSKTDKARREVDRLIKQIVDGFDNYNRDLQRYNREMEEYNKDLEEWEKSQKQGIAKQSGPSEIDDILKKPQSQTEPELDYSQLSQSELQRRMDSALDIGDYDEVRKLSQYLKESRSFNRNR